MIDSVWPLLEELVRLVETEEDDMDDAEMDVRTSPLQSFSNPFAEPAKAKPKLPQVGSTGMSMKPGQKMAPPDASKAGVKPMSGAPSAAPAPHKPKYRGSFVGQQVDMGGTYASKPTAWQDKASGQMRFGKSHPVRSKNYVVWDGNDWVTPGAFDQVAKAGKLKR